MKKISFLLLSLALIVNAQAQKIRVVDSLNKLIIVTKNDTSKALLYNELGKLYDNSRPDTGLLLQQKAMQLSLKGGFLKGEAYSLNNEGIEFTAIGNYPKALSCLFIALKLNEERGDQLSADRNFTNIGNVYSYEGDHRQAITFFLKAKATAEALRYQKGVTISLANLGNQYHSLAMRDSALVYEKQAYLLALKLKDNYQLAVTTRLLGEVYSTVPGSGLAMGYFRKSLIYSARKDDYRDISATVFKMAVLFNKSGQSDSSLHYARQSMSISMRRHFTDHVLAASKFLTVYFKNHKQLDSAFHYQQVTLAAKDSLFSQEKTRQVLQLGFAERERQYDIDKQAMVYHSAVRFYIMLVVILFLFAMAAVSWRNNQKNQKARKLLQQQKEQIQTTLGELETAQSQLIQTAKMASLGELTAGIAHEIQNPLNFVKNFSEVSVELLHELKEEAEAGHTADVISIAADLAGNLEKINHHGKRAGSIVKGMLEHSRCGSGERESANINSIADEFFKLSYHGIRAKDKSFSAELIEHLDKTLPKASIVQQDIGRVLANIFNNAFYAVQHKQKQAGENYKPAVTVTTSSKNGQVTVKIKDNGDGIPDNIRDKIMQPFFTTKPSGEGTGLGLSLSYDIVVKGHGGSIMVDTKPGEFTEFAVSFPV